MARRIFVVESNPSSPEKAAEFEAWYQNEHLPEVLAVPGMVSATRYRVSDDAPAMGGPLTHRYMVVYEIDGEPNDVMAAMGKASQAGEIRQSDLLGKDAKMRFYEQL